MAARPGMKVLVLNSGSSSLKYQLLEVTVDNAEVLGRGLIEKIGALGSRTADHQSAVEIAFGELHRERAIQSPDDIHGIGHRIVHGGESFSTSVLIDDAVLADIEACSEIAPLHNPVNLKGYFASRRLAPRALHVAVFDTAFHTTLPRKAFLYGLPYRYYEQDKVRRYGFHGTSYRYILGRFAEIRGTSPDSVKLIACHLGNGCSVCAIDHGHSADVSMGFTPLEGLLMGSRCGDIDAAAVIYLMQRHGLSPAQTEQLLNRECGLLGVSGISNDMRDLLRAAESGNQRCRDAVDIFCYRITKYIGAYFAALDGADAVIFTGGIGEHSPDIRAQVCRSLSSLGLVLDEEKNRSTVGTEGEISGPGARVAAWTIPTNEELMIARDTFQCVSEVGAAGGI
jgi:acetate kinase